MEPREWWGTGSLVPPDPENDPCCGNCVFRADATGLCMCPGEYNGLAVNEDGYCLDHMSEG